MSSHTLNNVLDCVCRTLLYGQVCYAQGWHSSRRVKVQSTEVGGSYGIQMFHTSKIKEGADNSSLERETFRLSFTLSLSPCGSLHFSGQLEPAEKHRVRRTQLPLTGLVLGVKFLLEDFLHVLKKKRNKKINNHLLLPESETDPPNGRSDSHLIFLSLQRLANQ